MEGKNIRKHELCVTKDQPTSYTTNQSILDKVGHFFFFRIDNKNINLSLSKDLETRPAMSPIRYFQIVAWELIKFKYSLQRGSNC